MTNKKVFFVMIAIVVFLCLLSIAGVVMSNMMLQKESKKLVDLKLESRLLEEQQSALVLANKNIQKYSDLEKIAKSIVPQEKDQARTVREIVQFAEASGVKLQTISFPTSTLGQAQPKPLTAPTEGSTDTAPKPATPPPPPVTQVKPVEGISGVYSLEITVQSVSHQAATYGGFLDFLSRLERNRRTAHVTSINITPAVTGDSLSFSLVLNVYIKP